MTPLLIAALSAVLYGTGTAVEHRQAARTPTGSTGQPWLLARLMRQPLWLAGAALEAGGFATHTAALSHGSLAAVQMILGCSLLVSVTVSTGLGRRALPGRCWLAIFTIVAAVSASITLLGPDDRDGGHATGPIALAALATGLITVPFAIAGLLATGRRTRPLLLAVAAGLADACVAVLTKAFADSFAHGLGAVVTSWPLYALIVVGLASLTLTQAAYQTDTPLITLPVIMAVMPFASLAVGIVALHETAHLGAARSAGVIACLACAVIALAVLARISATLADPGARPAATRRLGRYQLHAREEARDLLVAAPAQ